MANILEISNWDQLIKARSEDYENLRIFVKHFNCDCLVGTQINVVDYNTNEIYFSSFVDISNSTIIPNSAKLSNEEIIEIINNFGFHVRISEPIVLSDNVITILKGLYEFGYRYIYKYYPRGKFQPPYAIYASVNIDNIKTDPMISKTPNFQSDEWEWCEPFKTYPIKDLIDTGTVNNGLLI